MKILDKLSSEKASTYALRVLKHNIVTLELEPGMLISENDISSSLGVSRTPIREALIELSKTGLVDIVPQKGSYVSKIDFAIIEEAGFMREVLENAVLRLACESVPTEYIIKLKANLETQKLYVNSDNDLYDENKCIELDDEFHRLLFESVNKLWTYNVIKNQMTNFDRLRFLTMKSIKNRRIVDDHENIVYAIEKHDFELAEMLMTKHLRRHNAERIELVDLYPQYFK